MSFKGIATKIEENHYILPKVANMKCEVHAFLSERLYQMSEETLWRQISNAASYEGVTSAYLMPDTHSGYGVPIGSVIVTDDTIIQAASGYDISCGVIYLKVPKLSAQDVAAWDKREKWIEEVEKRISTGVGNSSKISLPTERESEEILRYGAKVLGVKPELCERQYIPVSSKFDSNLIQKAKEKIRPQLCSVGGGNHFVEMQVDEKDGSVWVMIHCGSRGYGWQTANYFFYEAAKLRGYSPNKREQSWLKIDEELGKLYWEHHNAAANYAIANRHLIVDGIQDALKKVFKVNGEVYFEISHNLVQQETLILPDGSKKKGFVHRKGATRAFPSGHPDLVGTKWEKTGHPCLIPGSMYDGAAILFAKEDAYKSCCSVNHGSGRLMARGEAKEKLKPKQKFIDGQMKNVKRKFGGVEIKGIVGNTKKTPLDECSHVYKDLDDVLEVLEKNNIAEVKHRLYPVANIKGVD